MSGKRGECGEICRQPIRGATFKLPTTSKNVGNLPANAPQYPHKMAFLSCFGVNRRLVYYFG
jgi:hypothetical protein